MPAPTENDYNVFYKISNNDKFKVMKGYLWMNHTMAEVARDVFPYEESRSAGEKVSVVTRCYGFGGQNHGVFRSWGIENVVTDRDLKEFIVQYPHGCHYDERGTEMYRFLKRITDKRIADEQLQRQREQAAENERRRREAEERRRQELLRRQQEEEERRIREYQEEQIANKNRAHALAAEAENIMINTMNCSVLKQGIDKYLEAMNISWSSGSNMPLSYE